MRPGEAWGEPLPPDAGVVDVAGGDVDLVAAALAHPDAVLRFAPDPTSDFARAIGLTAGGGGRVGRGGGGGADTVVACDLLDLGRDHAVNVVVAGPPPDRLRPWHRLRPVTVEVDGRIVAEQPAAAVAVANGQFLRGVDLVPRGHPGDGRVEVQVYGLPPGERAAMRHRLAGGTHVPHPRILQAVGQRVSVRWHDGPRRLEVDGRRLPGTAEVDVVVRPKAARILV